MSPEPFWVAGIGVWSAHALYVRHKYKKFTVVRDATQVPAATGAAYALICDEPTLISMEYCVSQGAPVSFFLGDTYDLQSGNETVRHVSAFSQIASLEGRKEMVVPRGNWSIVVTPHCGPHRSGSFLRITITQSRAKWLQPEAVVSEMEAPRVEQGAASVLDNCVDRELDLDDLDATEPAA